MIHRQIRHSLAAANFRGGPAASLWAMCFAVLFCMAGMARAQAPQAAILHDVGIDQHLNTKVPLDLAFRDEAGTPVHLSDLLQGRPIILVLVQYRCPSLCTVVLNDLLSTLKVIPQDIGTSYDVWAVSIDPQETPEIAMGKKTGYLKSYLRMRPRATNASAGWHFLTGDQAAIGKLAGTVGYRFRWDPATQQFVHPAALILLTPDLKVSRYFFGVDYDPTDLRLSLVESSNGKIGTLTDQLLLFCYHYDPSTGKYGLAVMNALRIGGALTIVLLGGIMALLWRADRRRTRRLMASVPPGTGGAHE